MEKKRHGFTKFFVIVGALLAVVAIVLFICGMSAADWDFRKLNTVNYIYMRYEQGNESISSVNIRYESADITVKVSDQADKISVQYPVRANPNDEPIATVRAEAVNGTLYIAESEQNWEWFSWNFSSPAVTVIIPADAALDSLTLSTDYGNINAASLSLSGNLNAETDSGNISVSSVTAAGNAILSADNGNINLSDVTASKISAETDNGNIAGTGTLDAQVLIFESELGDIQATLAGAQTEYSIRVKTELGNSNVSNATGGPRNLTAETEYGNIRIYFEK